LGLGTQSTIRKPCGGLGIMNKTTTPYNHTPVDLCTLTIDLVGAVKSLVRIYENPWRDTDTSHTEQLQKQIQHVKVALKAYDSRPKQRIGLDK
jgi:hypothetical protein